MASNFWLRFSVPVFSQFSKVRVGCRSIVANSMNSNFHYGGAIPAVSRPLPKLVNYHRAVDGCTFFGSPSDGSCCDNFGKNLWLTFSFRPSAIACLKKENVPGLCTNGSLIPSPRVYRDSANR